MRTLWLHGRKKEEFPKSCGLGTPACLRISTSAPASRLRFSLITRLLRSYAMLCKINVPRCVPPPEPSRLAPVWTRFCLGSAPQRLLDFAPQRLVTSSPLSLLRGERMQVRGGSVLFVPSDASGCSLPPASSPLLSTFYSRLSDSPLPSPQMSYIFMTVRTAGKCGHAAFPRE